MLFGLFFACRSDQPSFGKNISSDSEDIASGEKLFLGICSPCHNFKTDGIGPNLSGLTRAVDSDWIVDFIRAPRKLIQAKDERAMQVFGEYQTFMPGFGHLDEAQINQLVAYMHTFADAPAKEQKDTRPHVETPYPDTVPYHGAVLDIVESWTLPSSADRAPFARLNQMTCEKSQGRLFVHDLRGTIYELKAEGGTATYFDVAKALPAFVDRPGQGTGLGSFSFHPLFAENGLLYTTHCEKPSGKADQRVTPDAPAVIDYVLLEWTTDDPSASEFHGTSRELLRMEMVTGKHGMQGLAFNPTAVPQDPDFGMLYLGIGDGGCVEDGFAPFSNHEGTRLWSSILRIDPLGSDAESGHYGIPKDNPFVNDPDKRGEIWAYGLRNPNQLHWDIEGTLYATDIGLRQAEEVNLIEPGAFYGWPMREGHYLLDYEGKLGVVYSLPADDDDLNMVYPVLAVGHPDLRAIIGGGFYYGDAIPLLTGKYLFGDIPRGDLMFADLGKGQSAKAETERWKIRQNGNVVPIADLVGSRRIDLRFGFDCQGDLYLMSKANATIYRVVQSDPI